MTAAPGWLLVGAVGAVGVLHTIVPDHWVPITLIARRRRWSRVEVARAAAIAGTGHTLSTLAIGLVVWIAGVAFATRFGNLVSTASSLALVAFGGWIALASLRDVRAGHGHGHDHAHDHAHDADGHDHDHDDRGHAVPAGASSRTALLLILGSSPMVEGIPAFFAAAKDGPWLIAAMAAVFAIATIATYVVLCVSSAEGLGRVDFGPLERYGEVLSGAFIAIVGLVFLVFPLA